MTPPKTSQISGQDKFLVLCAVEINLDVLKSLLNHDRLILVEKTDLLSLLTGADLTSTAGFCPPLQDLSSEYRQTIAELISIAQTKDGISTKGFVVLDQAPATGKITCQVAGDIRLDEEYEGDDENDVWWEWTVFRCELSSVTAALEIMDQDTGAGSALRRRNEAAECGGVWCAEDVSQLNARPARINLAEFPKHEAWDEYSLRESAESSLPYVPVFRTAEISLETLNHFLASTYDQDWGDESIARPRLAFVTSLTPPGPFHAGAVLPPPPAPSTSPVLLAALLGASPAECDAVVRSRFPQPGSELNYNRFIIMDAQTAADGETVVLACNCEFGGQLQLVRCVFKGALLTLLSPEETVLTINVIATEAVENVSGVCTWS